MYLYDHRISLEPGNESNGIYVGTHTYEKKDKKK